jgi:hypothetical protein
LERRAGIEPANAGFADLSVSHFATGAHSIDRQGQVIVDFSPKRSKGALFSMGVRRDIAQNLKLKLGAKLNLP